MRWWWVFRNLVKGPTLFWFSNARKAGAFTLGITNEPRSEMAGLVDEVLLIRAGKERSVAATKTYTGQLLMFHLLAAPAAG